MFSIILIAGACVGGLVLLVMLYVMCRSCNSRSQTIQDVENNRHRVKYQNDQLSTEQTHPQRRPHTQLLHEAEKQPRPEQRGTREEGLVSESRNSRKRLLLNKAAIMKHIKPNCNSDSDACNFSNKRDKKYETKVNHVFKVNPNEFMEVQRNGETVKGNIKTLQYPDFFT